jgi:acyl-CoA reductase-like NAD-dependent aldehyde dehydrogenase
MGNFSMTVAGAEVPVTNTFPVINPATGQPFAEAPECTRDQLDQAFASAAGAFTEWRKDETARREVLSKAADLLFGAAAEIGPVLTAEQGKPLGDASGEVIAAGIWFKYFANLEIPTQVIQDDDKAYAEVVHRPLGVVAAITPWNFPVALASWKIAPALLAGNTMVLKPSPFTPLATLKLGQLLSSVLPPGVLNVVSGGDELGAWMTSHPVPRKISFTGSVATGKHVAASAAPDLKRVTLELGGNDPAIVLDDVDPEAIADGLFWGAFSNNGQICSAIKRVYVPEKLYEPLVDALVDRAQAVKVGDGASEGTQLGPINNKPQFERVTELVSDAIAQGAKALTGGRPMEGSGYFFEPTILAGLSDGTRIVDEEQFGPALPVIAYSDLDNALERANATHFGLSGSVWGTDVERAAAVAAQLECGTSWVNSHLALAPNQPFGGSKWSGIGVENGVWGYEGFTELQVRYTAKDGAAKRV